MSWINYLLEANLYLALFYAAYYLLFRRETYYQLNRIYLLSSSALAFLIPILQLGILKPIPAQISLTTMPEITAASPQVSIQVVPQPYVAAIHTVNYYLLIYVAIALLLTLGLAIRLLQLFKLAKRGNRDEKQDFMLIEIDDDDRAFSFFNYLFIGKNLSASSTIIQHELVHIRQRHSLDIIYLEILKIICWFNPFVYLLQYSVKELHEYIADNYISTSEQDVDGYTDFLISNAYGLSETALTNNFFNNKLLKNRIMMLHQTRSGSLVRLKYLVALPLLAGMLCLSTLGFTKNYTVIDLAPGHLITDNARPATVKSQHKIPPPPPAPPTTVPKVKMVTKKGYAYEESGYLVKGKTDFRVIITEKNGEQIAYFKNSATRADLKLLNNKYGYTFPIMPLHDKMPPPATPIVKDPQTDIPSDNYVDVSPYDTLYKQLIKRVKYPAIAREKDIQGRVFVAFDVDNNNKAGTIKIVKSPADALSNEVIRSLTNANAFTNFKQGVTYVLPINFLILNSNPNKQEESSVQNNAVIQNNPADLHHDQRVYLNEISVVVQAVN